MNHRILVFFIFLLNLVGWLVIVEANSMLAPHGVTLHLDVLLILFGGLYFSTRPGLLLAVGLGFFIGSTRPLPIGMTLLSFLGLWVGTLWMARRLRRDRPLHVAGLAAGAQAFFILVYALLLLPKAPVAEWPYFQRILVDMLLSAGVAALLAAPWIRLQLAFLTHSGWNLIHQPVHQ